MYIYIYLHVYIYIHVYTPVICVILGLSENNIPMNTQNLMVYRHVTHVKNGHLEGISQFQTHPLRRATRKFSK